MGKCVAKGVSTVVFLDRCIINGLTTKVLELVNINVKINKKEDKKVRLFHKLFKNCNLIEAIALLGAFPETNTVQNIR